MEKFGSTNKNKNALRIIAGIFIIITSGFANPFFLQNKYTLPFKKVMMVDNKYPKRKMERDTIINLMTQRINYCNSSYGVSFKLFSEDWFLEDRSKSTSLIGHINYNRHKPKEQPQSNTLLSLDKGGSTFILEVIDQDMPTIERYNAKYFKTFVPLICPAFVDLTTVQKTINGKHISVTHFSGDYSKLVKNNTFPGGAIEYGLIITALHKGKRFMFIILSTWNQYENIQKDIDVFYESLLFE